MRDGIFAAFLAAMSVATLAPRPRPHPPTLQAPGSLSPSAARRSPEWTLQASWLAQRESALGDWDAVRPPLREGDEIQLTVLTSEEANVYVLDGEARQIFPPPGAGPSMARVRAGWPYAIPGLPRTWRLDGAEHDTFFLVAARHPLADPAAALKAGESPFQPAPALEAPLRDGKRGLSPARLLRGDGVLVDSYRAR
jgi:hypothetical protein